MTDSIPSIRRSSRSTKGQNSRLEDERKLEEDLIKSSLNKRKSPTPKLQPNKRNKLDSEDESNSEVGDNKDVLDDENEQEGSSDKIRCLPCGTTTENYDQDTDKRGIMICCDLCDTWQHAKCMGFITKKSIPKEKYVCNFCHPDDYPKLKAKPLTNSKVNASDNVSFETEEKRSHINNNKKVKQGAKQHDDADFVVEEKQDLLPSLLMDESRERVVKLFNSKFDSVLPDNFQVDGSDKGSLANKWALELENEVHQHFEDSKKYNEKARSLSLNLTKYKLIDRFLKGEFTLKKIVILTPEEMNSDLQTFAENVRKESIRQSVIKAEEQPRIRRTHKGEEVVENNDEFNNREDNTILHSIVGNQQRDDEKGEETATDSKENSKENDETENQSENDDQSDKESEKETSTTFNGFSDLQNNIMNHNHGGNDHNNPEDFMPDTLTPEHSQPPLADLDDDLDMIINGNARENRLRKDPAQVNIETKVWNLQLAFPGLADFEGCGSYYGSTAGHNSAEKLISLSKKLLTSKFIEIEGRLDVSKANSYLSKISATRDLFLIELQPLNNGYENKGNFIRLFEYFAQKGKYGVITDRPSFVKDCYLVSIMKDQELPAFFHDIEIFNKEKINQDDKLFFLFVVKKDFQEQSVTPNPPATVNVDTFLNDLQQKFGTTQQTPVLYPDQNSQNTFIQSVQNSLPVNLSPNDIALLQRILQQHPEVSHNPNLLFELLKQQQQSQL